MRFLMVLGCVLFLASGCSTTASVKNDGVIVPASATEGTQLAKPDIHNGLSAKSETEKNRLAMADAAKQQSAKESLAKEAIAKEAARRTELESIANAGELEIILDSIYFDFDSPILSHEARKILANNAEKLKKASNVMVRIEGNCDERGSDEYNLALGERRAKSALQYLAALGVSEKRLSIVSYGKEKPVALMHDEASWAKNRRDEFVITKQ